MSRKILVRVFPDEGDPFPVWTTIGADPKALGLSELLTEALRGWQRQWERNWAGAESEPDDDAGYLAWQAEGHALVSRLRDELSHHRYEVVADF